MGEESLYDFIDELYVSPSVKRQIRQTVLVARELRKVIGHDPKKIFIEMARGKEKKPERKPKRKQTCWHAMRPSRMRRARSTRP